MHVRSYYLFSLVFVSTISLGMEEVFNPNFFKEVEADLEKIVDLPEEAIRLHILGKSKKPRSKVENSAAKRGPDRHFAESNKRRKGICNICNKPLSSPTMVNRHIDNCHIVVTKQIKCPHSGCPFVNRGDWPDTFNKHHNKAHGGCPMMECSDCSGRYHQLQGAIASIKTFLHGKLGDFKAFKDYKDNQLETFVKQENSSQQKKLADNYKSITAYLLDPTKQGLIIDPADEKD